MRPWTLLVTLTSLLLPASAWAQEENWTMHPIWWPSVALAAAFVISIALGWVLLNLAPVVLAIVGAVLGIHWLMKNTSGPRSGVAVSILRERTLGARSRRKSSRRGGETSAAHDDRPRPGRADAAPRTKKGRSPHVHRHQSPGLAFRRHGSLSG